jgi:hypothetical protein
MTMLDCVTPDQDTLIDQDEIRELLSFMGLNQSRLAFRMKQLGDHRPTETILRGIQRMSNGDAKLSGEMRVLLNLLKREYVRLGQAAIGAGWVVAHNGSFETIRDGFRVTISPQSRGRWSIEVRHEATGYSPPWPRWEGSIHDAKVRAMSAVEDAVVDVEEIRNEALL